MGEAPAEEAEAAEVSREETRGPVKANAETVDPVEKMAEVLLVDVAVNPTTVATVTTTKRWGESAEKGVGTTILAHTDGLPLFALFFSSSRNVFVMPRSKSDPSGKFVKRSTLFVLESCRTMPANPRIWLFTAQSTTTTVRLIVSPQRLRKLSAIFPATLPASTLLLHMILFSKSWPRRPKTRPSTLPTPSSLPSCVLLVAYTLGISLSPKKETRFGLTRGRRLPLVSFGNPDDSKSSKWVPLAYLRRLSIFQTLSRCMKMPANRLRKKRTASTRLAPWPQKRLSSTDCSNPTPLNR